MPIGEINPFIFIWIGIGAFGSLWLLIHPSSWRALYIGWRGIWGLKIDPESPVLSDTVLRIYGICLAAFVAIGAFIFIGQEKDRWEQEQAQKQYDPNQALEDFFDSLPDNQSSDSAEQ